MSKVVRLFALATLVLIPAAVRACATCATSTDERLVNASNTVLWALLGLVGFIFTATGATVFFLWRKAATPVPPHIQFIESLSNADADND